MYPAMNTRTPIDKIERELNKFFDSLDSKVKLVKTSFILSLLDLSCLFENIPQKSPFNPESFLKLYLFKRIKVIKRYPKIIEQLQKDKQQAINLGFYKDENNELF